MSQQNLKTCFCGLYNADLHAVLMLRHLKCTENCRSVHICADFALTEHLLSDEVLSYFSVHRLMLLTLINIMISLIRHKSILQNIRFIIRTFLLTFSTIWLMFSFHFLMPTHIPTSQSIGEVVA